MTRHGPVQRSIAVAASLLVLVAATMLPAAPAQAAVPSGTGHGFRPARNAWDHPTGDDPDRLIVTFRRGTSSVSRRSSVAATGASEVRGRRPSSRTEVIHAKPGTGARTIASLRADRRVERVSVDHR